MSETRSPMDELMLGPDPETAEAGVATDGAVAEACKMEGLCLRVLTVGEEYLRATDNFPEMVPFHPSADWNDAMFAAEKFGLFDCYDKECHLSFVGEYGDIAAEWCVCEESGGRIKETPAIGAAPTGPLAICRAILKLAQKETNGM